VRLLEVALRDLVRDDGDLRDVEVLAVEVRLGVLPSSSREWSITWASSQKESAASEKGTHRRLVARLTLDLLIQDAARRGDEAEEGRRGVERARAELGVRLQTDKVLVLCA